MLGNLNRSHEQEQVPIYAGAKVVGHVKGDVFFKKIMGSKHFLRRPSALAFDTASLKAAEKAGATKVEVMDMETRNIYKTTIAHIWQRGFRLDKGYGAQIALQMTGFICARYGFPHQTSFLRGES